MATVDEARVEAAIKAHYDIWPIFDPESAKLRMSRALAAADAVRDQQGAPSGPGWSAEPEAGTVSAAGGDHPSRMALLPLDDAARSFNDSILPSQMIFAGGEAYDELTMPGVAERMLDLDRCAVAVGIYRAMTAAAPAIEARSAETQGVSAAGESAVGEAGAHSIRGPFASTAPLLKAIPCSSDLARRVAQIARERDEARAEVAKLTKALEWDDVAWGMDAARRSRERIADLEDETKTLREEVERLRGGR